MSDEAAEVPSTDPIVPAEVAKPETPEFSAKYDRETLMANVPEGMDAEGFGKYLDKTVDPYASYKNYSNIEKMKSKGLPNAAWEDSDYKQLNVALGVPAEASLYEYSEETVIDDDSAAFMKQFSLESGHTPKQAQAAVDLLIKLRASEESGTEESNLQATSNMQTFLESEWGHRDSQAYVNNHKLVTGVLDSELGIKADSEEYKEIFRGNPKLIGLLKSYAETLDPVVVESFGAGDTTTPASLVERRNSLMVDMNKLRNTNPVEFKKTRNEWLRLGTELERISR